MEATFVEVLLVEDNRADADLTEECLKRSKIVVNLNVVEDGNKAMSYLRKEGQYVSAVRPDVILLDLNLPKKNGREVLEELKNDEDLKFIPVVVLTTSDRDKDILESYGLGANCYITKPIGLEEFAKVIESRQ